MHLDLDTDTPARNADKVQGFLLLALSPDKLTVDSINTLVPEQKKNDDWKLMVKYALRETKEELLTQLKSDVVQFQLPDNLRAQRRGQYD